MNYLVVGQHRYNSADSWREHLVFSSDKELTDEELERKFYMHWVYKFSEECDEFQKTLCNFEEIVKIHRNRNENDQFQYKFKIAKSGEFTVI